MQSVNHLTEESEVLGSIPNSAHTFVAIDHEMFSTVILPYTDSRRAGVNYRQNYEHVVLVNCFGDS